MVPFMNVKSVTTLDYALNAGTIAISYTCSNRRTISK